jgi:hypothetical protein
MLTGLECGKCLREVVLMATGYEYDVDVLVVENLVIVGRAIRGAET